MNDKKLVWWLILGQGLNSQTNQSAQEYQDYNKDAYLDVHVKVFQAVVKVNGETLEEYIINAFSYTFKKMASNWCYNYMLEVFNYKFLKLTHTFCKRHQKTQNGEQIYMELKI